MDARRLGRNVLDGVQYGVALTVILSAVLAPFSLLITDSLVIMKHGLFVAGLALMLFGAVKARPAQKQVLEASENWRPRLSDYLPRESYAEDGFGGFVHRLPPAAWFVQSQEDRLSDGWRFLTAWLVAWVVSYLLEAIFQVGVPAPLR